MERSSHHRPTRSPRPSIDGDVDFSLLDYKSVEDFLHIHRSKSDNHQVFTNLARQLKASRSLVALTSSLTFNMSPQDILHRFVESAGAIIDAERVFLLAHDKESGDLVGSLDAQNSADSTFRISSGVEYDAIMNQRGCSLCEPGIDHRTLPEFYKKLGFHVSSVLCVPIVLQDNIEGAFLAVNKIGPVNSFSQFDMYCLSVVACNAAIAFRYGAKHVLDESNQDPNKSLVRVNACIEEALKAMIAEAYGELQADKISLFMRRSPSSLVCLVSPDICGLEVPSDAGFLGLTFKNSQAVKIQNAKLDTRHYSAVDERANYATQSLLSYPVLGLDEAPLGVLQAVNKTGGGDFTEADQRYMTELCVKVGRMVTRIELASSELRCRKLTLCLGKFASTVSRLSSSVECSLNEILLAAVSHCRDLLECFEVKFFSLSGLSASKDDPTQQPQTEFSLSEVSIGSPSQPADNADSYRGEAVGPETQNGYDSGSGSGVHPSILDALRTKSIVEIPLDASRGEAFLPDLPAATALVVPLSTAACTVPVSSLFSNPVDVMVITRRNLADKIAIPFAPVETDGLSSFAHILVCAIRSSSLMREQSHLQSLIRNDSALMKSTLNALKIVFFVVSSENYNIVVHSNSTETLFGVAHKELSTLPLPSILGDMCPVFMADIRETLRSNLVKERRDFSLVTPAFPDGILVDYTVHEDLVDYKNNGSTSSLSLCKEKSTEGPEESVAAVNFCRVSIRVLEHDKCSWGDDGISSVYHLFKELSFDTANASRQPRVSSPPRLSEMILTSKSYGSADATELEKLLDWDFNVLKIVSHEAMRTAVITVFEKEINLAELNISRSQLCAYIAEVDKNYRLNPFHNFYHAVSVTHFIFMLMRETGARNILKNDLLYFSMLMSAIVHDVDHPGNTNLFEVHSQSSRALLYNDTSVLEHHHCSTAFKLMRKPGLDVFQHLSFGQKKESRKMIVSCILATDMDVHVNLVQSMALKAEEDSWTIESPVEKIFYGKYILHCADLSNPVRPFYLAKEWASRVSEEFNRQGELEKNRGLPVSTFLLTPDTKTLAKNEIYFSGQVVAPMWRNLAAVFPSISHLVHQIESNVQEWKELLVSLEN